MVVFAVVTGASAALVGVVVVGLAFGLWWGSQEEEAPLMGTRQQEVATGIGFSTKKGWVAQSSASGRTTSMESA
jgi:hypothetical protein